jgi:hypothetical protein
MMPSHVCVKHKVSALTGSSLEVALRLINPEVILHAEMLLRRSRA